MKQLNSEKNMERLLHYVWKYRLYNASSLVTTTGTVFTVLDPGQPNTNAGPDFFNAKIKVGQTVWAGSVEIHDKASDWFQHKHDRDKAYDTVILHVTGCDDATVCRTNGEPIPQFVLEVPEKIQRSIDWLLSRDLPVPCISRLRNEIDPAYLSLWMGALLIERLERKTQDIRNYLALTRNDWNETFYILLTRSFGSGVNSDAFEWLARSLPLRYLQKQRGSSSQIEALFFGQAGMLDETNDDPYYRLLQREYQFLRYKFELKPLDESLFKKLRIRPPSFPHLKIAQLAALWTRYDTLFSALLEAHTPREVKSFFQIGPSEYWLTHNHFRYASPFREKPLGNMFLQTLLINAVVPIYMAYGKHSGQTEYVDRALRLLEIMPPEKNSIVELFTARGVAVRNAGDSQALIQLKRNYCEMKKCLHCRIGFKLLQTAH